MKGKQGRAAAGDGTPEGPATGKAPGRNTAAGAPSPPQGRPGGDAEAGNGSQAAGAPGNGKGSRDRNGNRNRNGNGNVNRNRNRNGNGDGTGNGEGAGNGGPARDDTVSAVVRQWQAVRPDLDTGPMEIIGRVNRCAALLQQAEDAPLRRAGLTRPEFDLLGALRRKGQELTPSELVRETYSSGAAVTKRLKQLAERGLVERRGDTRDRRVAHLRLTDAGRDLVDGIMPEQLAYESAALSAMDDGRQGELADLLGELLSRLEGEMRSISV
jgi:DNA-binding MarR family transcriptional regulator